ncbi:MAG: hypothetical protein MJ211_01395 [Bacteroidales bacterium]|nr:hypothetical protein [Bacteroidales bacterium]
MQKISQTTQVIEAMRKEGGFATLRRLNEIVDFSTWATKTPEASVRRIVQKSKNIFRIQPGLWALEEMRNEVLQKFELQIGNQKSEEVFSHGYFQGLLIQIGKFKQQLTYVPAQDKGRKFMGMQSLEDLSDTTILPNFTYEELKKKARTIDVIWFNERKMPSAFYEVEHTTDIKNSLSKFYELQDFHAGFYIVAKNDRKKEFEDKLNVSMFEPIKKRVMFLDYDRVVNMYEGEKIINSVLW